MHVQLYSDLEDTTINKRHYTKCLYSTSLSFFFAAQVTKVEIKFKSDWLHHMDEHASTQYRLMDGNIQDAVRI